MRFSLHSLWSSFVLQFIVCGFGLVSCAAGQPKQPGSPPIPKSIAGAVGAPTDIFPGAHYNAQIPTVESVVGFKVGDQAATHDEILACFRAWEKASDRVRLVQYATTYEGRESFIAIITSPGNMARLDEIRAGLDKLADPRTTNDREAKKIIQSSPATAWLAHSIHGDELSGADGALALGYHLAASTDDEVTNMLDDLVVLIDPHQNPDGRDRYLQMVREHRGAIPNTDWQSILHGGYWPVGRTNHYYFDLNRDWIFGVNPETRGRIREASKWKPMLFTDAHEMGALDTYLFAPARAPVNPNFATTTPRWANVFAKDQAAAFDQRNWLYYTGEWNENWYPGYTDSWGGFRGAVPILYEQAGVDLFGVKQRNGATLTYRESAAHHAVSGWTNLRTLVRNKQSLLRDFYEARKAVVAADSPYAKRVFAITPTRNAARLASLVDLLHLEGFEAFTLESEIAIDAGVDRFGHDASGVTLPAGTILIPNRQPEGRLLAAMFEFDPKMGEEFLKTERREILRSGGSRLYDITAWSIPLLYDLDAYQIAMEHLPASARPIAVEERAPHGLVNEQGAIAFVIDGASDSAPIAAARLMEENVHARVAQSAFRLDGGDYARGSVVVTNADNRSETASNWRRDLARICDELDLQAVGVKTGLEIDPELPDLGGGNFTLLTRPRVAIVTRGKTNANSMGAIWHLLDQTMGIPAALIDADKLTNTDLRAYNVIIVPDGFGAITKPAMALLRTWTQRGGTLVAVGGSAAQLATAESDFVSARTLAGSLEDLDDYERAALRELASHAGAVDVDALWSHGAAETTTTPWDDLPERPSLEERKTRDAWRRDFMPQGAVLAARADVTHWLTFGVTDEQLRLPAPGESAIYRDDSPAPMTALYVGRIALMAKDNVTAPLRLGVVEHPNTDARGAKSSEDNGEEAEKRIRVGWSALPDGSRLLLRASGLLWPEAGQRLANTALITQERKSAGQVILFASDPVFRGATLGTARMLMNAIAFGPGLGASAPIEP